MAEVNDYIEVTINTESEEDKDILLAQLTGIGFEGFEEEKNVLKAFISFLNYDEALVQSFLTISGKKYATSVIKNTNWNEAWETGFEPVIIEDFCAIRALFHQPVSGVRHELIITPKMSFGTGHHATTCLMIEAMRRLTVEGKLVFDFGTGTGVLAILAEKMGASAIEAIDVDEWSIENGKENLLQNHCKKINLYKADRITSYAKFDLLLANINRNIIIEHLRSMKDHLLPGGVLVLSGLLEGDITAVSSEIEKQGLQLRSVQERKSWICLEVVSR